MNPLFFCLLALPLISCGEQTSPDRAAHVTRYDNEHWFVPANSGLGPAWGDIKAFVLYDGTVCTRVLKAPGATGPVSNLDDIAGILCVSGAAP